jgi:predicted phage-related endonuclease
MPDALTLPGASAVVRFETREEWLAARLGGLGGSDVPRILKLSPHGGPWSVWAERKVAGYSGGPSTAVTERGNREEPRVLADYCTATLDTAVGPLGTLIVRGDAPLQVSPDAFLHNGREWGVAEVKTDVTPFRWGPRGRVIAGWTPEAATEIREDYAAQCYAILAATGLPWCRLIVRRSLDDLRWYTLVADPKTQRGIIDECRRWWQRHIVDGVRPPLDSSEDCARALAAIYPPPEAKKRRPATAEEVAMAKEHAQLAARVARDQEVMKLIEAELAARIGDDYGVEWGPPQRRSRVNFQATGGARGVDMTALRRDHPEIVRKYATKGAAGRRIATYIKD